MESDWSMGQPMGREGFQTLSSDWLMKVQELDAGAALLLLEKKN